MTLSPIPFSIRKRLLIVALMIPIAGLHFITGPGYHGPFPIFVNGYLIDILLPFGLYLLSCLVETAWLRPRGIRALLLLAVAFSVEIAQGFGLPLLGRTYDPWDFVMYALGVGLGLIVDAVIFARLFPFWEQPGTSRAEETAMPQRRAPTRGRDA